VNLLARYFGRATGQHRAPRPAGALVDTAFRHCEPCGVDTVVVVHGDGSTSCTETHAAAEGDPT
jgi:protein-L-isoaspartate O-methyltransferase